MVIPMSAPGLQVSGPMPPEAAPLLVKLKWSIMGMIVFGALRFLLAMALGTFGIEFMAMLNMFLNISMGAFILKDDIHLKKFYTCLASSIFQTCAERGMGGTQCLFPFVVCAGVNLLFDVLSKSMFFGFYSYGLAILGTVVAQGAAVYFGWKTFKICQAASDPSYEMEGANSGYFQTGGDGAVGGAAPGGGAGGGGGGTRAGFGGLGGGGGAATGAGGGAAAAAAAGGNFSVFSGEGNRLGG